MAEILELYKSMGETPLECILRFKENNPDYSEKKMVYLGRLDPMAEGLLLVMVGKGNQEDFFLLDKTYEFEVLWGVKTDTYDILGEVLKVSKSPEKLERKMAKLIEFAMSRKIQRFPPYSSKPVMGKPLFEWAREGKIEEIKIPEKNIKVFSFDHIHTRMIKGHEVLNQVEDKISKINGDFRQEKILKKWKDELEEYLDEYFLLSKFSADVSSGTYIRGLANEMGDKLGCGAIAYSIKRTRVGEYEI